MKNFQILIGFAMVFLLGMLFGQKLRTSGESIAQPTEAKKELAVASHEDKILSTREVTDKSTSDDPFESYELLNKKLERELMYLADSSEGVYKRGMRLMEDKKEADMKAALAEAKASDPVSFIKWNDAADHSNFAEAQKMERCVAFKKFREWRKWEYTVYQPYNDSAYQVHYKFVNSVKNRHAKLRANMLDSLEKATGHACP